MPGRVLLTGASGFVGQALYPELTAAGWDVYCGSRDGAERARRQPERHWVTFDVGDPRSVERAVAGMTAIVYLVHAMGQQGDFETRERAAAEALLGAADGAGVARIVYLGGVAPEGHASKHLRSRLATGEVLRSGQVATIELRAGMIIGADSISWKMVRDLSARLPFMILPSWLQNHSQPIGIDDVVFALARALSLPTDVRGVFDLPGPETMTGEEILRRIGKLLGVKPYTLRVPVLTPRLSSYWLKLVTSADLGVAQELVEGLTSDLVARNRSFHELTPERALTPFDVAAERALGADSRLSAGTRALEWALQRVSRRA
jgi:uncharacterized protein YbjT (DUF2867 family)